MRVDRVFALLIESGFVYCCIWVSPTFRSFDDHRSHALSQILYAISAFGVIPDPGFIAMAGVSVSTRVLYMCFLYTP